MYKFSLNYKRIILIFEIDAKVKRGRGDRQKQDIPNQDSDCF